ncbi:MAG TPA: hypothetical protein DCZ94_20400 [Lentisphaeria bacterium]|nr:MAG: hypothetical protein A2X48_15220 [Lentisphaerae bacterium GWF2_49_21]HBC89309.1 hypothetical protein [Lentisphaeria bacterium]
MILRITHNRDNPYVVLNKEFLNSRGLSLKAKGLLCCLLALPDDWRINLRELSCRSKDGATATRNAVGELIRNGYIVRRQDRKNGRFRSVDYDVRESPGDGTYAFPAGQMRKSAERDRGPASNSDAKNDGFPLVEKRHAENSTLLSNIRVINNESYESRDSSFPKKVFQELEEESEPESGETGIPAKIPVNPDKVPDDVEKPAQITGKLYRIWICCGNSREEYIRRTDILPELTPGEADCLERSGIEQTPNMQIFYRKAKALLGEGEFCMICHEVKNMELEGKEAKKNSTSRFIHYLEEAVARPKFKSSNPFDDTS